MVDQIQELGKENGWREVNSSDLPLEMTFNGGHVIAIISYSVLMVISAVGNITFLVMILRRQKNTRSRINSMIMHLAIADLMVTFILLPLEIGWNITVAWWAGDGMCRIMAFFRTFGLYLSGFVLICISIDRYYAVLKPLSLSQIDMRGRLMLTGAWAASTVCSIPQMFIFHVESHPNHTWYEQCVTYHSFPSKVYEELYKYFGMLMMYGLPLCVILFTYSSILWEIYKKYHDGRNNVNAFRRSSVGFLGRAKIRTLKMTVTIVVVFLVCWTPYYVMCVWYWIDNVSAQEVDQKIQKALFIFASTNSCMNPIVYGLFNIRRKTQVRQGKQGKQGKHPATFTCNSSTKLTSTSLTLSLKPME